MFSSMASLPHLFLPSPALSGLGGVYFSQYAFTQSSISSSLGAESMHAT